MHRSAWRGLLRHGDELLERGDLRPLPPFGRVGGRRAARVAKGKLEGAVVVVMDRDRRLRLDKLDHLDALLGVHRYQQQAKKHRAPQVEQCQVDVGEPAGDLLQLVEKDRVTSDVDAIQVLSPPAYWEP